MYISSTRVQETISMSVTTSCFEEKLNISTLLSNRYCCEYQPLIWDHIEKKTVQEAGFNAGWIKKIFKNITKWRFFESIRSWFRDLFGFKKTGIFPPPPTSLEILTKTFEDLKSNEEVSTKLAEYFEKVPRRNYNTIKVIRCLKQDADEVRFMMWDGNIPTANKIIRSGTETIKLFEYDIKNMREYSEIGENGVEYVCFRIPKHPEYVLNGKYADRIYFQCLIFRLPKDTTGNLEKFRAFLKDLFTHPMQLWDEWHFRKELSKFNINSGDVQEIEEYRFAKTETTYENSEFFEKEVA